jgi:diaminohydroxyphosphoribosylaminopyrimidine deaminase/5-amino-6-(5-phosphoribosylamino)uracil reductase
MESEILNRMEVELTRTSMNENYFHRAIELAGLSHGTCSPNPNVGAVIVKNGRIIGEGRTQPCGQDHAEVQALKNATENPAGAELYVTLEPCCHFGKTPPCTNAIIAAGIKTVYAGIHDPNPKVDGKGFSALIAAGIHVESGFEKERIEKQLEAYLVWIRKQRPYILMKTASSLDGRLTAKDGTSRWITGEPARREVHRLRQSSDAVLTGIGTVLKDDPLLTCRLEGNDRQPVRIVLDSHLRMPDDARLFNDPNPIIIFHASNDTSRVEALSSRAELVKVPLKDSVLSLPAVFDEIYARRLQTVLVEAGGTLNSALLREHRVDKWIAFQAPITLGEGMPLFPGLGIHSLSKAMHFKLDHVEQVGSDIQLTLYPRYQRLMLRLGNEGLSRLLVQIPSRPNA